jgi:hypothetical protein
MVSELYLTANLSSCAARRLNTIIGIATTTYDTAHALICDKSGAAATTSRTSYG